ncbi:hypothetical protein T12_10171 [Trichinella patagoniensis]|uniref:Uncharacterized protein n=1 Tax=Trichinella patagoniensis TaxID=990121 RepID=A0A0V0Z753_9BILA|nr:hypothetical protein T12_10171 [Trichinella patagoniensis]
MGLLRKSNFLKSVEFNQTANNSTANDSIRINRSTAVRMSNILQTTKIPVQVSTRQLSHLEDPRRPKNYEKLLTYGAISFSERAIEIRPPHARRESYFATILPPEPKHFGFPEAARRVLNELRRIAGWHSLPLELGRYLIAFEPLTFCHVVLVKKVWKTLQVPSRATLQSSRLNLFCKAVAGTPAGPSAHYNSSHRAAVDAKVCFNVVAYRAVFVYLAFIVLMPIGAGFPRYRHIEDTWPSDFRACSTCTVNPSLRACSPTRCTILLCLWIFRRLVWGHFCEMCEAVSRLPQHRWVLGSSPPPFLGVSFNHPKAEF